MKAEHWYENGTKHLFIEPENQAELEFLNAFFNSDDEVTVQLSKDRNYKYPRLIFGKSY